jgi:hypothetical protein
LEPTLRVEIGFNFDFKYLTGIEIGAVTSTLAYNTAILITTVKSFIVLAFGVFLLGSSEYQVLFTRQK